MKRENQEKSFYEYLFGLRRSRGKSLRETAGDIGVSPQYYSEVEKGRKAAFTSDKIALLVKAMHLSEEEESLLYDKAAESRSRNEIAVPQDFSDYIVERNYAMQALRTAKELNADAEDWMRFIEDLKRRKGKKN